MHPVTKSSRSIRLFLYSSLAIVVLTLVWGWRRIPHQSALAEDQLRTSLEQETSMLSSAAQAASVALQFRLLDVLKAEGNDHSTRAFQDSPFQMASLLEWDGGQWKILWHSTKDKAQSGATQLKTWMDSWPLASVNGDQAYFSKVTEINGQPYFVLITKVARPSNTPMLGVGLFPASQFGLHLSADQTREVRVFDDKGFALALQSPAYLGANLKREPIVAEILEGDTLSLREEWKSERGAAMIGMASRLSQSNLFIAVESKMPIGRTQFLQSWFELILGALGAIAMNWFLFSSLVKPLFQQLAHTEEFAEKLRRQMLEHPPQARGPGPIAQAELPTVDFIEKAMPVPEMKVLAESVPPPQNKAPQTTLGKVSNLALRSLETRIKDLKISLNKIGLDQIEVVADIPQLQTALEEIFKNAVESMQESEERQLTISGFADTQRIRLTVEDTGSGIAPENLKKVFDPFYSTKDSQGVARGLGLNVVRRVIEEMHGTIHVRNRGGTAGAIAELEWPVEGVAVIDSAFEIQEPAEFLNAQPTHASASSSDLDFLADDDLDDFSTFSTPNMHSKDWPEIPIRKPKVRTLD